MEISFTVDCSEDIKDYLAQREEQKEIMAQSNAAHYLQGDERAAAFHQVADRFLDLSRRFQISAEQFERGGSRRAVAECMAVYCKAHGEISRSQARRAAGEI